MVARPHHVDQLVDSTLGLFDEVEHRQEQLTILGEKRREFFRVEIGIRRDDLVAFRHRWWLLKKETLVHTEHTNLRDGAATDLFNFQLPLGHHQ